VGRPDLLSHFIATFSFSAQEFDDGKIPDMAAAKSSSSK
jgi:hypothetical protein